MSARLQGKVAIVTGSNSGIGRGIAVAYGREGAKVVCANRSEASKAPGEKDITTHDLIKKNGGEAIFKHVIITDTESVNKMVQEVVDSFGRVDILVNNTGNAYDMAEGKPFWELSDDAIDRTIDLNLKGTMKMTRAISGAMVKQSADAAGRRGCIISIGSVFGPRGWPHAEVYGATKTGIQGFSKSLAVDLAPFGIQVHTLNPGTVVTGMVEPLPEQVKDKLRQKALLGFGKPEDIAAPAVFLASDEAKWMTGTEIYPDSGFMVT